MSRPDPEARALEKQKGSNRKNGVSASGWKFPSIGVMESQAKEANGYGKRERG